ncbi:Tetratricopeptide-like helical domain [Phytophthora cactorum]|nr:Tetratricopeptide-like helical domain [Phytophthora cactorum]
MDVDVDAQARLQNVTLGMKQQADELLLANKLDKALTLYRELLMHLTRSQVTLLQQRELAISCHMNVLAVLGKAKRWSSVVTEASEALNVFEELQGAQGRRTFQRLQGAANGVAGGTEGQTVLSYVDEVIPGWELQGGSGSVRQCVEGEQALQKTELTGLIHGNLAAIYVKIKDDAKAIDHYKRTMLLTRCGDKPTAAQNERVYDIRTVWLDVFTQAGLQFSLSVIEDQIKLFPSCPDRNDREGMMYLNGGRICYTMARYAQAEEHLEKGYRVSLKASNQLDTALNCAYWLRSTSGTQLWQTPNILTENGKFVKSLVAQIHRAGSITRHGTTQVGGCCIDDEDDEPMRTFANFLKKQLTYFTMKMRKSSTWGVATKIGRWRAAGGNLVGAKKFWRKLWSFCAMPRLDSDRLYESLVGSVWFKFGWNARGSCTCDERD